MTNVGPVTAVLGVTNVGLVPVVLESLMKVWYLPCWGGQCRTLPCWSHQCRTGTCRVGVTNVDPVPAMLG